MLNLAKFKKLLGEVKRVLILTHENADPDALCSAFVLSRIIRRIERRTLSDVYSPDGVNQAAARVLSTLPFKLAENPDPKLYDIIFTVDTNTLGQLGELESRVRSAGRPIVMIDHHAPHPESCKTATLALCDESSTSTCEVILELAVSSKLRLSRLESTVLFTGMVYETGHFMIGTSKTFRHIVTLIGYGVQPEKVLPTVQFRPEDSERVARLKGAQRTTIRKVQSWIIVSSRVGSYQSSVARALVGLGAHVAIVAGDKDGEIRVSFRSSRDFFESTKLHLGRDIAQLLGQELNGVGGGHSTAAGAILRTTVEKALSTSIERICKWLEPSASTQQTQLRPS